MNISALHPRLERRGFPRGMDKKSERIIVKVLNTLLIFFLLMSLACQKQKSDADQVTTIAGGRCAITKEGHNYFCIDFTAGSDSNSNSQTCDSIYSTQLSNYTGGRGHSFLSGNANTCSTIISDTIVGRCTISGGVIYYYNNDWSAGSSQTDCTSEPGTWSQ